MTLDTNAEYGWALEVEGTITDRDTGQPTQYINGKSPIQFLMNTIQGPIRDLITAEELPADAEFMNSQVFPDPESAVSEAQQIHEDINTFLRPHGAQLTLQPMPSQPFTYDTNLLTAEAQRLFQSSDGWREAIPLTCVNSIQWNVSEGFKGLNRLERLAVSADLYNQYHTNREEIFEEFNLDHRGYNGLTRVQSIVRILEIVCGSTFPDDITQASFPGPFNTIDELLDYAVQKTNSGKGLIESKKLHSCTIKMQGRTDHFSNFTPYAIEHRGYDSRENLEDMLRIAKHIRTMNQTAQDNIGLYI